MGEHDSKAILLVPGYFGISDEGSVGERELLDGFDVELPNDHFLVAVFGPHGVFL